MASDPKLQGPAGGAVEAAPETSASKSTGTSQPTPGPWRLDESHEIDDGLYVKADGRTDYICSLGASVWDSSAQCGMLTAEDEANGQLIVLACNNHADLLDAVKGLLGLVQIITFRDDLPADLAASLKDNPRYRDADALVARFEGGA
jgi:hypothetical protein